MGVKRHKAVKSVLIFLKITETITNGGKAAFLTKSKLITVETAIAELNFTG
jgi:hypothetical protein